MHFTMSEELVGSSHAPTSFYTHTCKLYSKVLDINEWLVKKPRPSWNCE